MLHSRRSNIIPIVLIIIFVFATLHILSSPASTPDAASEKSSPGWKDWIYGAEDIREKDKDNGRWQDKGAAKAEHTSTRVGAEPAQTSVAAEAPKSEDGDGDDAELEKAKAEPKKPESQKAEPEKTEPKKEAAKPAEAAPKPAQTCSGHIAWKSEPLEALNTTFEVPDDIYYDPKGPRPDQIVILSATDGKGHNGGIDNIVERAAENRKAYCAYQGYQYHFVNISKFDLDGAHPVWKKLPAIVETFNTYPDAQWILMLDLDAIIMSPEFDIRKEVLSLDGMKRNLKLNTEFHRGNWKGMGMWTPAEVDYQNTDFLIAQDHNGVNAGSFMVRRSKYIQFLIDMWADPFFVKMTWPGQEQDTILHFIRHHHVFRKHVGVMKQRMFNAFVEGNDDMRWHEGDLLVHLAGCWVNNKCAQRWEEFWNKRIEVPAPSSEGASSTTSETTAEEGSFVDY